MSSHHAYSTFNSCFHPICFYNHFGFHVPPRENFPFHLDWPCDFPESHEPPSRPDLSPTEQDLAVAEVTADLLSFKLAKFELEARDYWENSSDSSRTPSEQDNNDTLITLDQTLVNPMSTAPSNSGLSLRATPPSDDPVWTHTKNPAVNHELDHLKTLWHTIKDTVPHTQGFTHDECTQRLEENNLLMLNSIKKRVAVIQVGARVNWSAVPGSELQKCLQTLDVSPEVALTVSSNNYGHSFRSSKPSGGRKGRSNKTKK